MPMTRRGQSEPRSLYPIQDCATYREEIDLTAREVTRKREGTKEGKEEGKERKEGKDTETKLYNIIYSTPARTYVPARLAPNPRQYRVYCISYIRDNVSSCATARLVCRAVFETRMGCGWGMWSLRTSRALCLALSWLQMPGTRREGNEPTNENELKREVRKLTRSSLSQIALPRFTGRNGYGSVRDGVGWANVPHNVLERPIARFLERSPVRMTLDDPNKRRVQQAVLERCAFHPGHDGIDVRRAPGRTPQPNSRLEVATIIPAIEPSWNAARVVWHDEDLLIRSWIVLIGSRRSPDSRRRYFEQMPCQNRIKCSMLSMTTHPTPSSTSHLLRQRQGTTTP
ncbi:hypothetical protein Hypma_011173 [Hypsizygus marmoreus]|uniref:Uncharacterized protein n=1 Tax=Hypsizygus marmoreus TaxID=39966 RepID=A0A369JIC9_HYPMA|nr:hypothetical protein Hypma_011173 [Hypsizygus marmoreus]